MLSRLRRILLGLLVALALAGAGGPIAWAQVPPPAPLGAGQVPPPAPLPPCQRVPLTGLATNVDLLVPIQPAGTGAVRLAGLQLWPDGWPLFDVLPERAAALARGGICLSAAAVERTADGMPLTQAWLLDGRGALAVQLVRAGFAQVASDAETTVPALAPALRAAEAEARAQRRGIWDVLGWLTTYPTPNGGTATVDARVIPALDALAQLEIGRPIVDTLAQGVTVFMLAEPTGIWAHYDNLAKVVGVDLSFWGADPRSLAALLSHEITHAQEDLAGTVRQQARTYGRTHACYADEYRATTTELDVWQQLYGTGGNVQAAHPYERQTNADLQRLLREPQRFVARLVQTYASECQR